MVFLLPERHCVQAWKMIASCCACQPFIILTVCLSTWILLKYPELHRTSVVFHAVCTLSRTAFARRYLAMMSSALAVQTKGLGTVL